LSLQAGSARARRSHTPYPVLSKISAVELGVVLERDHQRLAVAVAPDATDDYLLMRSISRMRSRARSSERRVHIVKCSRWSLGPGRTALAGSAGIPASTRRRRKPFGNHHRSDAAWHPPMQTSVSARSGCRPPSVKAACAAGPAAAFPWRVDVSRDQC